MVENRLAIVVDGTSKMAYYWQSIYKNFLQRIVRNFCQNKSISQDPSLGGNYALGLIVYRDDSLNACPVQPSAWTKDMDIFLQWLSGLSFNGSGQNEAPIAEGLSNALMMFPSELSGTVTQQLGKRHCILVAANNPSPVPRALLLPKIKVLDTGEITEVKIECQNADAETVASSFPQSFVSLSVICPRQFPKLREIYNAGNISQLAEGSSTEYRHPQLLVIFPKSFVEACAALRQLEAENRSRFKTEPDLICPFSYNFSEDDLRKLSQIFEPSTDDQEKNQVENDNGDNLMNRRRKPCDSVHPTSKVFANNIPTNTEQLGSNVSRSTDARTTTEAQCSCSQETSYIRIPSIGSSSNIFSSQQNEGFENFKVEFTPTGIVLSHGCAQVDPRLSKPKSRNIPESTSWSVKVNSTRSNCGTLASMDTNIFGNMKISQPSGVETAGAFTLNLHQTRPQKSDTESDAFSSSSSPDPCVAEKRRLSQLSEDLQQSQRADRICGARMAENENCVKRKRFNAVDHLNVIPRPRLESVGREKNNQASSIQSQAISAGYIKAWEGGITAKEHGKIVLINRLVVYRKETQSEKIFARWPRMLHLDHLIFGDNFNNIPYDAAIEHLTIDEVAPCSMLDQMEERRLSAYIKLPQHTLILSNSNKKMRFIGQLYDRFYPLLKNQIYSP